MNEVLNYRQLEYLFNVSNILNSTLDLDTVIETIMSEIITTIDGADVGVLFLYDHEKDMLVSKGSYGFNKQRVEKVRLKPGESMTGMTFLAKRSLSFPDRNAIIKAQKTLTKRNFEMLNTSLPVSATSTICSPIIIKNKCIGVITIDCLRVNKHFLKEDIQLLEAISHQIAVAIEKTSLYKEKEQTIKLLEGLNKTISSQNQLLTRSIDMHNHLSELVLQGEKLEKILDYLYERIGNPLYLVDLLGEVVSSYTNQSSEMTKINKKGLKEYLITTSFENLSRSKTFEEEDLTITLFPVGSKANLLGFLLVQANEPLNHIDTAGLEHACSVISLQLLKEQELFKMEQAIHGKFIEELFSGRANSMILQKFKQLQMNLDRQYQVILIDFEYQKDDHLDENQRQTLLRYFTQLAQSIFLTQRSPGLVVANDQYLIVLVSYDPHYSKMEALPFIQEKSKLYLESLKRKHDGFHVAIIVGGLQLGLENVYKSSHQAQKCVQFVKNQKLEDIILCYDQLGVRKLLIQNSEEELIEYVMEVLGNLLEYENQTKNSDYLQTLITYVENNQKAKATAKQLHIHLNTLTYRIKRIEEILGIELNNHTQTLDIFLAINIYQMVKDKLKSKIMISS
jgi:sugar diacid utilization regulator/GAF domain-containing protein